MSTDVKLFLVGVGVFVAAIWGGTIYLLFF